MNYRIYAVKNIFWKPSHIGEALQIYPAFRKDIRTGYAVREISCIQPYQNRLGDRLTKMFHKDRPNVTHVSGNQDFSWHYFSSRLNARFSIRKIYQDEMLIICDTYAFSSGKCTDDFPMRLTIGQCISPGHKGH
jgi:hypothetical protein